MSNLQFQAFGSCTELYDVLYLIYNLSSGNWLDVVYI